MTFIVYFTVIIRWNKKTIIFTELQRWSRLLSIFLCIFVMLRLDWNLHGSRFARTDTATSAQTEADLVLYGSRLTMSVFNETKYVIASESLSMVH